MRFYEKVNVTKVNLIPNDFSHIRFMETFKTDFNQLIYNLSGILGLWLGLSPISIAQFRYWIAMILMKLNISRRFWFVSQLLMATALSKPCGLQRALNSSL
jgi:hypothetical protein